MLANHPETSIAPSCVDGAPTRPKDGLLVGKRTAHDREFRLLAAAALWPRMQGDREAVRALAGADLDWEVFIEMVLLHRLAPLVYRNLLECAAERVPPATMLVLEQETRSKGMAVFQSLAEILRLMKLFAKSSIDLRVLKGIPLAILVYGDAGLRDPGDIDLLIAGKDIVAADRLLRESGYVRVDPEVELTPRRYEYYVAHWKDFVYQHEVLGHSVELHWRLTRNRAMPGELLARPQSRSYVTAGSVQIPTLAFEDHFLYLCLHGAMDGWMRLKSLADIAALCREMKPEEAGRLAELAKKFELMPEMTAALLLAKRVFGIDIDVPSLLPNSHPVARRIVKFSWRAISACDYRLPREDISGGAWVWYELGLRQSAAYRWQVLQRVLFRPRVWSTIDLPDRLFLLYPILSPIEWLFYHGARWHARRNADH